MRRKPTHKGLKLAWFGLPLFAIPLIFKLSFMWSSSQMVRQIGNAFPLDGFAVPMFIGAFFLIVGACWYAWDISAEANS